MARCRGPKSLGGAEANSHHRRPSAIAAFKPGAHEAQSLELSMRQVVLELWDQLLCHALLVVDEAQRC